MERNGGGGRGEEGMRGGRKERRGAGGRAGEELGSSRSESPPVRVTRLLVHWQGPAQEEGKERSRGKGRRGTEEVGGEGRRGAEREGPERRTGGGGEDRTGRGGKREKKERNREKGTRRGVGALALPLALEPQNAANNII